MTTEWLATGEVADITHLIAEWSIPAGALFLGEQQPARFLMKDEQSALLIFVPFEQTLPFSTYTSGRIFHRDFELRWQQDEDGTHVVYLGTRDHCPLSLQKVQEVEISSTRAYYLFGERVGAKRAEEIGEPVREGDYIEVRVPRLLRYPIQSTKPRVTLRVCESIDKLTGEVIYYRFQGIEEAAG